MKTRIITTIEALTALQPDWNRLFSESGSHVFASYSWVATWWKFFGKDADLAIFVVEEDEKVIALAPLMRKDTTLSFIGTGLADYGSFLGNPVAFPLIVNAIHEHGYLLHLRELPEESETLQELRSQLDKDRTPSDIFFDNTCYLVDAKLPVDTKKKDIHRNENFLKRQGSFEYREVTDRNEAQKLLPLFFAQHDAIWKNKKLSSTFQITSNQQFLSEITLTNLGDLARLHVLFLDNKMIAGDIGFLVKHVYTTYANAYDLTWEPKGPGMILRKKFIEQYVSHGISVDFSRGTENYKTRFANAERKNFGIATYSHHLQALHGKVFHKAREYMMRHPRLHDRITQLRAK